MYFAHSFQSKRKVGKLIHSASSLDPKKVPKLVSFYKIKSVSVEKNSLQYVKAALFNFLNCCCHMAHCTKEISGMSTSNSSVTDACLQLALEGEKLCKTGNCRDGIAFFEAALQV